MTYFNIVAANRDELLHIRYYQTLKIYNDKTWAHIVDIIKKGEACWIVSSSNVAFAPSIKTGHVVRHVVLPEEQPPAGSK